MGKFRMVALKSRQHQIPGGLQFQLPDLRYKSSPFASFQAIVNSVHTLLNANKEYAETHGLPTSLGGIADMVDRYNAEWCKANRWTDYYVEFESPDEAMAKKKFSWPVWARAIAAISKEGERGVGDTVERVIGKENSENFKAWAKTAGFDCNCDQRKEWLNVKYPY